MFESFLLVFHFVCAMIHFMLLWNWRLELSWVVVVNDVRDTGLSQFFSLCIVLSFEQFFELFRPLLKLSLLSQRPTTQLLKNPMRNCRLSLLSEYISVLLLWLQR